MSNISIIWKIRRRNWSDTFLKVGRILAISIIALWCVTIITTLVLDALGIARANPDDFWRTYFIQIIERLAK
ncbi:MAG: hypothetical protein FJ025_02605 [Chloroflexi bacterium]|nr:hypothetical protein [Chloroflexota bacterium]